MLDGPVLLRRSKPYQVSRDPTAPIHIKSDQVSRRHAVIRWQGKGFVAIDQGSSNGTFVNGHRLKPGDPCFLHDGDRISFAGFEVELRVARSEGRMPNTTRRMSTTRRRPRLA
jgi:pSer/pThr/pTyr-binding forkhead associated (FHA) protein